MTERDDFDKIVEGLELDLDFLDEIDEEDDAPEPSAPEPSAPVAEDVEDTDDEVPFYRRVTHVPLIPKTRESLFAWGALLGAPLALVVASVFGQNLPRPVLAGAVLTFVAAAIYLISQLPEHGPSRPDWPDDGAVL